MAKVKYTFAEALLKISELNAEESAFMKLIEEARKRVLAKPGAEYKRVTVALEAGLATAKAVTFLPLIEAIERGPNQEHAPHDPGAITPLPDPLADAIKEMQSVINRFGSTVSGLMRDSLNKENERTRSAFEPRMLAAETSLRDMIYQKNDHEGAAGRVAAEYEELNTKHNDAKECIEKLEQELMAMQIATVQAEEKTAGAVSEVSRLRAANRDLQSDYLDQQEIHRDEVRRLRDAHEKALNFEQNRVAELLAALLKKEIRPLD